MLASPPAVTHRDGRLKLQKKQGVADGKDESWMDRERQNLQAYEYLCHVGEAKEWIEACVKDKLGDIGQLDEELRNGIALARLAKFFCPSVVKKIFEDRTKLQYRHSDNINYLFDAMRKVGLPEVFIFETTDLYDKKNIPKVIYCIHALSHYLAKKGLAPKIKDLLGKLTFTEEELDATQQSLEQSGVNMPQFGNIGQALADELKHVEPTEEESKAVAGSRLANIVSCQAQARMHLERKRYQKRLQYFKDNEKSIVKIQSLLRMRMGRIEHNRHKARLEGITPIIVKLQAIIRGRKDREEFLKRQQFYKSHLNEIVKMQALWRSKHVQKAYKSLASLNNPNLKVVQEFLHLLEDTENEFEEEMDIEGLRQLVIKKIRETLQMEQEVNELDIKIALLVKNRISLEEVAHLTSKKMKAKSLNDLAMEATPTFSFKKMDKETRKRLENYGHLFHLLQTQPHYLSSTMFLMNKKSGGSVTKFLEQVTLSLYGYAQNPREEYLLLNLIKNSIKIEVEEITEIGEFWRSNPLFIKLVMNYIRGAKERQFLRELLQPLVNLVIKDNNLDLELDPITIYKFLIREEEVISGEKSKRPYDVTVQQAAADPEVKNLRETRTAKLQEITSKFLEAIFSSIKAMPYGIRNIASQMKEAMRSKFPNQEEEINRIVGNLVYYRYMNPVIVAPEAFDVIESAITPIQRKNLAEVAKTLHQIAVAKPAELDESSGLKIYICNSGKRFSQFVRDVANVQSAEEYFSIDEYMDINAAQKPTIYISPNEILQIHRAIYDNLDDIAPEKSDPIRQILGDLGTPPPVPEGKEVPGNELALVLVNRFAKLESTENVKLKHLLSETKRMVLTILRVQSGKNILDILEAAVTEKEEQQFAEVVRMDIAKASKIESKAVGSAGEIYGSRDTLATKDTKETLSPSRDALSPGSITVFGPISPALYKGPDGNPMTFSQLKRKALENMAKLEAEQKVTKENGYQDMLNLIAKDMINKHKMRIQRKRELQSLNRTLSNLEQKAVYLEEQKKTYCDYVESCMGNLGSKKGGKKKAPLFLSKQYYHLRELQKNGGSVPQFGSYKYTAAHLYKKGVLIGIDGHSPKQYGAITLTISSNESGVFSIEASFMGVKFPEKMELRLEELLQYQYNSVHTITLFDIAKVNVNLLLFLLNKKFFV
ncbi:uncharacterized protein BJ171DRAFT_460734 [Polychytrium aggregatum]|uniref:uncharacterized protein n=1 Tax=Polychytrium aggregatum TaxID=110093 RepID=UPI0022FE25AE|nr:uncharacterized protein BJ171DRAFT_460734 [Polychytrium aggregatum]KAI9202931.1 hypothetical protein BJ171DRAFT_460734 [Polychytrium aggregatum]